MADTNNIAVTKHVAIFAFPFATHAPPLLSLVRGIAAESPNARFSFFSTAMSNQSIFSEPNNEGINNIKPYNVPDGLPEGYTPSRNPVEPVELSLKAMPGNFRSAMEVAVAETGLEISCFMSDAFFGFVAQMAEEMHVPWVALWTAGPRSLIVHLDTEVIRQRIGINGKEDQTLEFIPVLSVLRAADLPEGVVSGDLESPFASMLHHMGQMLPRATAVAINSFEELDPNAVDELKSRFQNFLNVGPFPLAHRPPPLVSDEHGCLEWLDKHNDFSVAYISFGSVISPPPHELAALAEALEATGFPFLWSFRGNVMENLPKGFTERMSTNGKFVPWAPQMQVLAHRSVGVFVTHCGWNSILESVITGVPVICRPFFGDQRLNMRVVEAVWGIGMGIEGGVFTKNGVVKALEITLSSENGKEMREKAGAFGQPALLSVAPNGSSNENFKTLVQIVTK